MRRRPWIWILIIVILVAGGGYYYYTTLQTQPEEVVETAPATAQLSRGDIILTTLGVGTLLPSKEVNLSFGTSGTLQELMVRVGDQVNAGDVLARLDDTALRIDAMQTTIDFRQAELDLVALQKEASLADIAAARASIASAQADHDALLTPASESEIAAAQSELLSAQQALVALSDGLSVDEQTTLQADLLVTEIALQQAQADYNRIAWRQDVGATSQAAALQEATIAYEKALAQFNLNAAGPKQEEITAARAKVSQAQASLNNLLTPPDSMAVAASEAKIEQAQAQLNDLLLGPDAEAIESAELAVEKAMYNLDAVNLNLSGSIIEAPVSGIVTAVTAQIGEQVGTSAIITIAEADTAQVRFWIEELDVSSAVVGNVVNVIFEAFPEQTITGEINRVEPTLVEVDGALAVQAWATIDLTGSEIQPMFGMNAEVEIIAGETQDALLVPVQALRELVPGQYAVFVVLADGELEFRPVEAGLRDFVNAEILSGLNGDETVSTGDVETQ
ncbi:MAG: HlyD family efflux transporter periplasmic adaptor subunit [Chloroflexota bacterium]